MPKKRKRSPRQAVRLNRKRIKSAPKKRVIKKRLARKPVRRVMANRKRRRSVPKKRRKVQPPKKRLARKPLQRLAVKQGKSVVLKPTVKGIKKRARRPGKLETARRTQLVFLKKHGVPHEAWKLSHRTRRVQGERVTGISAPTVKDKIDRFVKRKKGRGLFTARLIVTTKVGKHTRTIGTRRIALIREGDWMELLSEFGNLNEYLELGGTNALLIAGEKMTTPRVTGVTLELINVAEKSVDL